MAVDFFKKFVNDLGDPDTAIAADGTSAGEFTGFIDSGSYILNAALSGSLFGGLPNNKAIIFAGDPATGKTFFALGMVKHFLAANPDARVFYFDTESALTKQMFIDRGIDPDRVAISAPPTIEAFRTTALKVLDAYAAIDETKRFKLLLVLDSLSMLPSVKEVTDITEGKDTKDMTKAPIIKGAFRVLRLKMAKLQVPMIVTNHVYAVIGAYVPTKDMSGGSGAKYAADTIVFLSKAGEKDKEKQLVGNVITVTMKKSRLTREGTKVKTRILFDGGLDRYHGLLELAEETGVVKKEGLRYKFPHIDKLVFEKAVIAEPEKFWTEDVLKQLDEHVSQTFKYTGNIEEVEDGEDTEDDSAAN